MKKILKHAAAVLLTAAVFTLSVFAANKYSEPTSRFFVNDFADVIDKADEEEIFCARRRLTENNRSGGNGYRKIA